MVSFSTIIEKFAEMGEKTGWTYVFIPFAVANEIKDNFRKSFRVKGKLDAIDVEGLSLVPMGNGDFILPLKKELRKKLSKEKGAMLQLSLEEDKDFKIEMPYDLEICLSEEVHLIDNFLKQAKSVQNYFIKWINEAKTEATRVKRLSQTVEAMDRNWDYSEMIRANKKK